MATRYINPIESQSAHAVKDGVLIATPDKLAFIVSVFAEIDPKLRKRIATAINLAGNKSMSSFPAFLEPIIFYALTQDFESPWGYHPFHASPDVSIKAISDTTLEVEKRLDIAKVMLKADDRAIREWAKMVCLQVFNQEQLAQLGLQTTATVTPEQTNAMPPESLINRLMTKLGLSREEAIELAMEDDKPITVEQTPPTTVKTAKSAKK